MYSAGAVYTGYLHDGRADLELGEGGWVDEEGEPMHTPM